MSSQFFREQLARQLRRGLSLGAAALVFGLTPAASPGGSWGALEVERAHAQAISSSSLADAQQTVEFVRGELVEVEKRYLKPEMLSAKFSLETRFNDARVAYELGQYDRAGFLFLDVVSRADASFPGWRASHYYLAQSMIEQRNYMGARSYLRQLVQMGPGEYYQESLASLLEVSYETDDYKAIEEIYAQLDRSSDESAVLTYLRGKTLFEQERYEEARRYFMRAAKAEEEFALKGRYFAAVSLVSEGKIEEALGRFEQLTEQGIPRGEDDARVYFLAYLSQGRIAYEQERYEEAIDLYSRLPRTDPNFVSAMYESAWANIQLEKYDQAERVIDILIQAEPSVQTYTEAMLLKADLSRRVEDYEGALQAYQTVLDRYNPVIAKLDEFAAQHENLRAFFYGLVREDLSLQVPASLPSIKTDFEVQPPEQWLVQNEELKRTRMLVEDVSIARQNVRSAYDDLAQIDARLNSTARIKSFPTLAQGVKQVVSLESDLIEAQQALVDRQAELIAGQLEGPDRASWQGMRTELEVLRKKYAQIPATAEALEAREEAVETRFSRMRAELDEVGSQIDKLEAELAAADTYVQTQQEPLTEEERARIDELRESARAELEQLEGERSKLRSQLAIAREESNVGGVINGEERSVREAYVIKLAEASDLLHKNRSLASDPGDLGQIERLRAQIPELLGRIDAYYAKVDAVVDEKLEEVRATVENLRAQLGAQAEALEEVTGASRQVAGEIALATFLDKRTQFDGIILRADVGKIDAMFQRKETTTQEINELFQKRTDELRALQEAFEEVR